MYGVQKWTGCRHRSEESIRQSACWSAGSSSLVRAWEQPSVILEQWSEQGPDAGAGYVFFSHWLYYLLAVVGMSAFGGRLLRRIISLPESETARTVVAGILFFGMMAISVAFLVTETYQPFLYFRF